MNAIEQAVEVLRNIARQHTAAERDQQEEAEGDIEGAYDHVIGLARKALTRLTDERVAVPPDRERLAQRVLGWADRLPSGTWDRDLLRDVAAALRSPADGWRNIESAPKDGTVVLLAWNGKTRPGHWRQAWLPDDGGAIEITKPGPSMWRPLPDPPAEEKIP